jgi:hypothetical protein
MTLYQRRVKTGPEDRLTGTVSLSTNPDTVPEGNGGWTRGQVKRDSLHYLQTLALYQRGMEAGPENRLKGTILIIHKL